MLMLIGPGAQMIEDPPLDIVFILVRISLLGVTKSSQLWLGLSSTEDEYRALAMATQELLWIQSLLAVFLYSPP